MDNKFHLSDLRRLQSTRAVALCEIQWNPVMVILISHDSNKRIYMGYFSDSYVGEYLADKEMCDICLLEYKKQIIVL